jgi:hypothetical protein
MIIEFWKTNENPITCYDSRKNKEEAIPKIPKKRQKNIKQPVTVESPNGEKEEHPSVVEAAKAVGMNCNTLYAVLNGRAKNTTKYKIYKSTLNN